ncbi:MAG: amino acid ABC transporter permease, partial [Ruthenibacterium sp.]
MPESFGARIIYLLERYGASYLSGAGTTLLIALVSTAIGCLIGFAVGIVQTIPVSKTDSLAKRSLLGGVRAILTAYVELFRGTPMMIQAVFIYYGAAQLFNIYMGMWFAAIFVVSINTGAYMAETVRGGVLSVDPGQTEGAKAIGMTHLQTMLYVILPQALRNIMPQIGNNLIINIK